MNIEIINIKSLDDPLKITVISNLLRSHQRGDHIITGDVNIFKLIAADSENFSSPDRAISQSICDTIIEYRAITKSLIFKIIIDFDNTSSSFTKENEQWLIKKSWKSFLNTENYSASTLVSENLSDYKFYMKVGESFILRKIKGRVKNSLRHHPGGGSQIFTEFSNKLGIVESVLCIVDSDKQHPEMPLGSTAVLFGNGNNSSYENAKHALVLNGHEVENLLPIDLIKAVVESYCHTSIDKLDKIIEFIRSNPNAQLYFDFKNGLKTKTIRDIDADYGMFWGNFIFKENRISDIDCYKEGNCSGCSSCINMEGLGDNILPLANRWMEENNLRKIDQWLSDDLLDFWNKIGEHIWSWGCGLYLPKSRT